MFALLGLPELLIVFVFVLIVWAALRPRDPFE